MSEWTRWGQYAIVNFKYKPGDVDKVIRMKGYAISKVFDKDIPTYIAWELPSTWLGKFDSVDKAKVHIKKINKA